MRCFQAEFGTFCFLSNFCLIFDVGREGSRMGGSDFEDDHER